MNSNWIDFYQEFASVLLQYKNDRKVLIHKLIKVYKEIGIKFPRVESDGDVIDIDPFTIFGFFNKGITEENRIAIIDGISKAFEIKAAVPNSFEGIPLLNNMNATFYRFKEERGENDINKLWSVYEAALIYADEENEENRSAFVNAYDDVKDLKGNRWKLSMGLYWIRPYRYMNLDSRNRWFAEKPENITAECANIIQNMKEIPNGSAYLAICDNFIWALQNCGYEYTNLPELSYYAWKISEKVNKEIKAKKASDEQDSIGEAIADNDVRTTHYWLYAPGDNAFKWKEFYDKGIMAIGWDEIGDLNQYSSKEEMKQAMKKHIDKTKSFKNAAHATWQFVHEIQIGDIVFVKKGLHTVIGRGVVTSDYHYDASVSEYGNIREVEWTHNGEWQHPGNAVLKTLTDITPYSEYVQKLNSLFEDAEIEDEEEPEKTYLKYTPEDFLNEVYMSEEDYETLVSVLMSKKNVILQGAPGVGKTFAAKRLAYSIMRHKDPERVMMVQFHQSYSYEDFIMGFRPSETGFELRKGAFYNFCKTAEIDSDNSYFFIIDEINRGNLSKIFGELFMLIENDKRGIELKLLYSDEKFSVPKNVYIIGMMNTADRSLAMLDYALRRRFSFIELKPGFETDGFRNYKMNLDNEKFSKLIACVTLLNDKIASDESLGEGFCIGHSYFCNLKAEEVTDKRLSNIVEFELVPLLKEYWFDEPGKVREWTSALRSALK